MENYSWAKISIFSEDFTACLVLWALIDELRCTIFRTREVDFRTHRSERELGHSVKTFEMSKMSNGSRNRRLLWWMSSTTDMHHPCELCHISMSLHPSMWLLDIWKFRDMRHFIVYQFLGISWRTKISCERKDVMCQRLRSFRVVFVFYWSFHNGDLIFRGYIAWLYSTMISMSSINFFFACRRTIKLFNEFIRYRRQMKRKGEKEWREATKNSPLIQKLLILMGWYLERMITSQEKRTNRQQRERERMDPRSIYCLVLSSEEPKSKNIRGICVVMYW